MADNTPNYSFSLPTVGGDSDLWGGFLNGNWSSLDDLLSGTTPVDSVQIVNGDIHAATLSADAGDLDSVNIANGDIHGNKLAVSNEIEEGVQTVIGQTPTIDPENGGTLCTWTLTSGLNHTPAVVLNSGESITLLVDSGTGTIQWTDITWLSDEPEMLLNTVNAFEFFKVGAVTYGAFVGAVPTV